VSREKLIGAWYLLLSGHGLGLALPCAGIGLGALTPHRQTLQEEKQPIRATGVQQNEHFPSSYSAQLRENLWDDYMQPPLSP